MKTAIVAFALTGLVWAKPLLKQGFQIEPPQGWRQLGNSPLTLACAGPALTGGIPATLNVVVQPEGSLEKYEANTLRELKANNGNVLEQKNRKFGRIPGREIIWTKKTGNVPMKYHSAFFCVSGQTYLFTGSAPERDWPQVGPILNQVVNTFRPR